MRRCNRKTPPDADRGKAGWGRRRGGTRLGRDCHGLRVPPAQCSLGWRQPGDARRSPGPPSRVI